MHTKIQKIDQLFNTCSGLKKAGKKIALCYGSFDLIHPGHIRYFESAKQLADVVVAVITPDKYVNKGPGRPVFNEHLRAESVSGMEAVDFVAISKWPDTIEIIKQIKPDFYVKGEKYQDEQDGQNKDLYLEEEEVLKAVGGQMYYTDELSFSSSKLINSHFNIFDDSVQKFLNSFKEKYSAEDVIRQLEDLKKLNVLVIGDAIIDEYHYCKPLGKSSKSATISSIFLQGNSYAGGVLAIANHIDQYAGKTDMITYLGSDNPHLDIIEEKLSSDINAKYFYRKNSPTPTKRRYLDQYMNSKLFEVTFMNDQYIGKELEQEIIDYIKPKLDEYDLVLLADFGHGLLSPGLIDFLQQSGKYLAINAQTNSNNYGFNYITKYSKADYISIDENEIRLPFGDKYGNVEDLMLKLSKISNCENIQITLGQKGSLNYVNKTFYKTPAFASKIKDSVGAGDAVLSVTALCSYNKADARIVPFIGNCVGALAVEIIGNEHPVYKKDLINFIEHFLK